MDPFTPIEVTPLYSRDGMQSQGKSVRISDPDAPTGWNEIGVVSPSYLLVHNQKVKDLVDEITQRTKIPDWKQRRLFFDGRRFVYAVTTDVITAEVIPGDCVRFGLIAYNSYDGSRALSLGNYCEHMLCSNGMTSEIYFARFSFRHHQGNINWDSRIEEAFAALLPGSKARLAKFASTLRNLTRRDLSMPDLTILRDEYLSDISVSAWGKIMDKYLMEKRYNAFGLLDACTGVFWHNAKQSYSDYRNNTNATDGLFKYASALR